MTKPSPVNEPLQDAHSLPPTPYVTAVMPCLDEEKSLALCISKAKACFDRLGLIGEVVVADNGSRDRSVEIATACGARVVHVARRGYGEALRAGISAAHGQIIIMGDSDDSYDWSQLDDFIAEIEAGNDLVIGNRFRGGIQAGAMPPLHRYLGNPALSLISRIAFKTTVGDFHCGMRAMTPQSYRRMKLNSAGMEFATEMVASAAHKGLRVSEVPVKLYPDKRDRPPHLRSFRDGWRHLRFILSHSPDLLFVWPGSLALTVGILLMLTLISGPLVIGKLYFGVHFVVLGAMLALIGTNILSMGLLGKMILGTDPRGRFLLLRRILSHPHLIEGILCTGGCLFTIGFLVDGQLLWRWIHTRAAMDDTVHLAIVASTMIVIGVELLFSSFIVFLASVRICSVWNDASLDDAEAPTTEDRPQTS